MFSFTFANTFLLFINNNIVYFYNFPKSLNGYTLIKAFPSISSKSIILVQYSFIFKSLVSAIIFYVNHLRL